MALDKLADGQPDATAQLARQRWAGQYTWRGHANAVVSAYRSVLGV
jgi:hypothetical protein